MVTPGQSGYQKCAKMLKLGRFLAVSNNLGAYIADNARYRNRVVMAKKLNDIKYLRNIGYVQFPGGKYADRARKRPSDHRQSAGPIRVLM